MQCKMGKIENYCHDFPIGNNNALLRIKGLKIIPNKTAVVLKTLRVILILSEYRLFEYFAN